VCFEDDGERITARAGASVLEVTEGAGKPIEAGCRMGVCGADPVCVRGGGEHLSPMTDDERATLERLGLDPASHRLACCARVEGPVTLSLRPDRSLVYTPTVSFAFDPAVERVVIIGNGIGGITTADHLRRRHPDVQIDVLAAEPHTLYNRMGISRLIYGRSAMIGLHLLPDAWYDEHRITCWLNTRAALIDREAREVRLATGERLPYDRLVLATGSHARRPPVPGFGLGGFVLRSSADAVGIRSYCQESGARAAVVAGGGLLGIEAAYALHKLGLQVTILERGPWLLRRQLDERGGELLRTYLHNLGLGVELETTVAECRGEGRLREVVLHDGRVLDAGVLLIAAGVQASTELAAAADLQINRGVLVDDHLRTSDPDIYAVGDVAECGSEHLGLWPSAVEQAEVAAENVAGGDKVYTGHTPVTMLKVVGVELSSAGLIDPPEGGRELVDADEESLRYKKIVVDAEDRVCGAILLGHPEVAPTVIDAVRRGEVMSDLAVPAA
jgi:NAD(P)H-nitrite reductase large subunit/ferredoxin